MNQAEKIRSVITDAGGIARTADFNAAGFANYAVAEMCRQGLIVRVRSGYYALPDESQQEEAIVARLFSDGIVCMDSALFYYGYSDKSPLEWHISFKRTVTRSRFKIDYPPVRCYMVQESIFELGAARGDWAGVSLNIYDRERTICDCFKRRSQMDSELFAKAVNAYAADDQKNLANLSQYAKKLRVYRQVTDLMEVLLNG
ncbi:type IV toxin-antitoxin system AbiEi family antitoxin domain-containing protein [Ruminococcaceae bacterium OttesenSCG-928-L11]|nr:type IV toxin-antitoxin system AbiEi family antitoxin domain-containing protein [Ruminococcaceae bacterium OttesenSCG-928-L11]